MGEASATLQAPKYNITDPAIAEPITALRAVIFTRELKLQNYRTGRRCFTSSANITKRRQKLVSIWLIN